MSISASEIKNLREKTGAGMMDCKKALLETNGNFEEAVDWLRKKGLSAAAKKSGRTAAEGLIGVFAEGNKAAIIELNSETDFVSRNDKFQTLASNITKIAFDAGSDVEKLKESKYPGSGISVQEEITNHVAVIGENMNLRRVASLSIDQGVVASYLHNAVSTGLGKIGVLVALKSAGDKENLLELGKKIAMHIAAARPVALKIDDVEQSIIDREKAIFVDQSKASGKPDNVIEKMVEGRINKFFAEVVLLEQIFVFDNKTKVKDFIKESEAQIGSPIEITAFERFELGEGIEQETTDFAEEVAKMAK
jgi:elongation factor Ts